MPAYHSSFNEQPAAGPYRTVGNLPLLPVKTKVRGPAPLMAQPSATAAAAADTAATDIIDETLLLFRANCFFRNYEIQGGGDRVLIYLILFVSECLGKLGSMVRGDVAPGPQDANKALNTLALANFALPGDTAFPLNALYERPADRTDADLMRQYLAQLRQETAVRLIECVYAPAYADTDGGKKPSKWWMSFQKRKFMNKAL